MEGAAPITGLRLKDEPRARLEEMAEASGRSMTQVVTAAINLMHEQYLAQRQVAEKRTREGLALLKRLEERLGEKFWREHGEVGIDLTPEGRVMVNVGGLRFFEEDGGQLVATRVRGGSADFAPIAEDGSMEWYSTPLSEPAMS
jgi:predicted transcriptional regulator